MISSLPTPPRLHDPRTHEHAAVFREEWDPAWDASWTWVNQGTEALSVSDGVGLWTHPAGAVGTQERLLVRSAPTAPYTITMHGYLAAPDVSYNYFGLVWRQSSNGSYRDFFYLAAGGLVSVQRRTTGGVFVSSPFGANSVGRSAEMWFRAVDDNTNISYFHSSDGIGWALVLVEARNNFVTFDQIGVMTCLGVGSALTQMVSFHEYRIE